MAILYEEEEEEVRKSV